MKKVTSLQEARNNRQKLIAQQYKDPDTRIAALEEDMYRAIDLLLDMEHRLEDQNKFLRKLLHLIDKHQQGKSTSR